VNRFRASYQSRTRTARPLILAHRGDSFRAPENTLEAARLGLQGGADGWELDVRLTLDGHPVVIHDESLLRTTDVASRFDGDSRRISGFLVGQFSLEEIRSLDAGSWFVDDSSQEPRSARGFGTLDRLPVDICSYYGTGAVRIPTLVEALRWTMDVGWLVNVEIKPTTSDANSLVRAVLDAIGSTLSWDSVTVSSFDHDVVEAVSKLEPRAATGALISGPLTASTEAWIERTGIDAVHGPPWSAGSNLARPLLVYTVNDAEPEGLARRLSEAGVAGLFTDDPVGMADLFGLSRS
jgi:glycerophosphoryl diester phosphodiesterase